MRFKIETSEPGGSTSPFVRALRKWVLIGAAVGALLVAIAGGLFLALAMFGGALVGAAVGAVYGVVRGAIATVTGD